MCGLECVCKFRCALAHRSSVSNVPVELSFQIQACRLRSGRSPDGGRSANSDLAYQLAEASRGTSLGTCWCAPRTAKRGVVGCVIRGTRIQACRPGFSERGSHRNPPHQRGHERGSRNVGQEWLIHSLWQRRSSHEQHLSLRRWARSQWSSVSDQCCGVGTQAGVLLTDTVEKVFPMDQQQVGVEYS